MTLCAPIAAALLFIGPEPASFFLVLFADYFRPDSRRIYSGRFIPITRKPLQGGAFGRIRPPRDWTGGVGGIAYTHSAQNQENGTVNGPCTDTSHAYPAIL